MSTDIFLPKLGFSMTSGTIVEWLVSDGGDVREGDPLLLLEADKSTNEIEAPATGRLRILVQCGDETDVGTVIGQID